MRNLRGSSLKTNLDGWSRGEIAVERKPAERNLTAFSCAVYSPVFDEPANMRLMPDAQA
jgi:hypothetical protein